MTGRDIPSGVIPRSVVGLCRRLGDAGFEAHLVGGCVRDLLLGREVHDWDVATSARPKDVQRLFRRTIPIGIEHGTVAVVLPGHLQVEVTTYRGEGAYSDGRRPDSVTFVGSLEEDLQRRDLTINAIAVDPRAERVVDPIGGRADLARRVVRAVGDPRERFAEDGLRCMRAVRFAAVLEFAMDPDTAAAIKTSMGSFRKVSRERVRDELLKLLAARRPSLGLELMESSGLLEEVLPELAAGRGVHQNRFHGEDVYEHSLRACDEARGDPILRLAVLLHDVGKPGTTAPHEKREGENTFHGHHEVGARICEQICDRLRLSREQSERICRLVRHHNFPLEGWTDAGLRRFVRRVGRESLDDLFTLRRADLAGRDGPDQRPGLEALRERIDALLRQEPPLEPRELAVDGRALMRRLGIPPGPAVGQILRALMERVLDDPDLNSEEQLLALADEIAAGPSGQRDD